MPAPFSHIDAMQLDPADYPERELGNWRIQHKVIEDTPENRLERAMSAYRSGGRGVPPGEYIGLLRGGTIVMSNTPDEMRDHAEPFWQARRRGGRVLIHGLGLGMVLTAMLRLPNVEHIDVVEMSEEVIELVGPVFKDAVDEGRVTIHRDDCLTRKWEPGTRWSVVWHDIWDYISADNLPQMTTLHRRFGGRCDWQGSWCRYQCERQRGGGY